MERRRRVFACLAVVCLAAARAFAQPFADDFESGQLLAAKGGRWSSASKVSGCSIAPSLAAAHRGAYGLRLVDADQAPGRRIQAYVVRRLNDVSGDLYFRYWMRIAGSNGRGTLFPSTTQNGAGSVFSLLDLEMKVGAGQSNVGGADATGGYSREGAFPTIGGEGWHLFEYELRGVGTADGSRKLLVDGRLVSASGALDFTGLALVYQSLGEPWTEDATFAGTVDFDDFRADSVPLASTLTVTASDALVGTCSAVTVGLVDSASAAPASAPYAVEVELQRSDTGAFFQDPACTEPAPRVTLAAGTAAETVYWRPERAGPLLLTARHPDFLAASSSIDVRDELAALQLAVGCAGGPGRPGGAALLAVIAWSLALRRRRGANCP